LLETERLLNESLIENDRLCELEKTALARIQEAESQHKSTEARLHKAECQVVEISANLEREYDCSSELWSEINKLRAELAEAWTGAQNAENAA
jgi:chromosome segregation ATPase